jgi:hypothetical protein
MAQYETGKGCLSCLQKNLGWVAVSAQHWGLSAQARWGTGILASRAPHCGYAKLVAILGTKNLHIPSYPFGVTLAHENTAPMNAELALFTPRDTPHL